VRTRFRATAETGGVMLTHRLQHLVVDPQERLRSETTVTSQLMADVMKQAGGGGGANSVKGVRLRRLIAAEAWTDAALALIALALPQWQLVRLVNDGEEWCCALSRHPQMPDWLDDAVEARHEVLPLAIVGAFVAAREAGLAPSSRTQATAPQCRLQQQPDVVHALCCDDFA
jgi:hypothetical protein